MKQYFNIIRIETSMDMGIGNRRKSWGLIDDDDLVPGNVFDIYDHELTVVSVDENEMVFTYKGQTFTVNRNWQVLGTPEFGIPNERISIQCRYVFFFSKPDNEECEWSDEYLGELAEQMKQNNEDGNLWKNIPLVRAFIYELKDVAPYRSENINPVYKAHYISRIIENDHIATRETPRLFHSL